MQKPSRRDPECTLDSKTLERMTARLRLARQMRGMTLQVMADAVGCSESLLSKIEKGRALPSLSTLYKIVRVLDVTMGWLFDDLGGKASVFLSADDKLKQ